MCSIMEAPEAMLLLPYDIYMEVARAPVAVL